MSALVSKWCGVSSVAWRRATDLKLANALRERPH
jgi:hypothetical protein